MDVLTRFIIEISIALLVSSATTFVITTVLKNLLIDLCGDVVRATFWSRFSLLMLFLTPLMFVIFFGMSSLLRNYLDLHRYNSWNSRLLVKCDWFLKHNLLHFLEYNFQ